MKLMKLDETAVTGSWTQSFPSKIKWYLTISCRHWMTFAWFNSCGHVMRQLVEIEDGTSPNSLELKLHSDRAPNSWRPDLGITLITTDPWQSITFTIHHAFIISFPVSLIALYLQKPLLPYSLKSWARWASPGNREKNISQLSQG